MKHSGMAIGQITKRLVQSRDKRRIQHAKLKNTIKFKNYRRKQQLLKTYRQERLKRREGKTYGAGEF